MHGYAAYKEAQASPPTRIGLILELYTRALKSLDNARVALTADRRGDAVGHLTKAQLIVTGLASGLPAATGRPLTFCASMSSSVIKRPSARWRERTRRPRCCAFCSRALKPCAASRVLGARGEIPPLERDRIISLLT